MDLLFLAKQLKDRFVILIRKTEGIEDENSETLREKLLEMKNEFIENKEITQQLIDGFSDRSDDLNLEERERLKEQIKNLEENEANSQRRIAQLEKEIFEQDGRIEHLTKKMSGFEFQLTETKNNLKITRNELTDTLNELTRTQNDHEITKNKLKEIEDALKTGQIAFSFEKDLATYIYPNDKKYGSINIFTNMKRWLEKKKNTPQGQEANGKWNALKREFSWSSEHERVFFKLLESRKEYAHPSLDPVVAQSQIPGCYTDEEKKCINDIVSMVERVNILMQQL